MALIIVGGLLSLVGFACSIIILVDAFKKSVGTGFLTLCVPCYILYYAFTVFQHPKKNLIIGLWLGCNILGNILIQVAQRA